MNSQAATATMAATPPHPGGGRRTVAICGAMTIYEAAEHKRELLAALADGEGLAIDLSAVDEMDTAGMQLLVLARREAQRAGKTAALVASSMAAQEVLHQYQLAASFGDDAREPEPRRFP